MRKQCGITANNQIWIPYLPSVRRKKIIGCGWGPRPSPRTVLQLVVFTIESALIYGTKDGANSCGIFVQTIIAMLLLSNTNLAAIQIPSNRV